MNNNAVSWFCGLFIMLGALWLFMSGDLWEILLRLFYAMIMYASISWFISCRLDKVKRVPADNVAKNIVGFCFSIGAFFAPFITTVALTIMGITMVVLGKK